MRARTALFVLLWSSGAIFSRLGLLHASPFAFLTLRFAVALCAVVALVFRRRPLLPEPGIRLRVAATGLVLLGAYPICYLLALDRAMTPGALASVMGVQPILTLLLLERRFSGVRLFGLLLACVGLSLVVWQSIVAARFSTAGASYALGALLSMTSGAISQRKLEQEPLEVLPLQYTVSLLLCLLFVPFRPFHFELSAGFLVPLAWLAIVISVVAQLLFYRLIRAGNLVNATSLFYLVPVVTVLMDCVFLGSRPAPLGILGMAAIVSGLVCVFRKRSREA